jgi:hypothetical protein
MRLQCAAKMSPLQCNLYSYRPAQLLYDADVLAVLAEEGEQQLALWPCTAMPRGTLADVMLNTAADATATAAPSISATDPTADPELSTDSVELAVEQAEREAAAATVAATPSITSTDPVAKPTRPTTAELAVEQAEQEAAAATAAAAASELLLSNERSC